ncbi:hypothetical protein ACFW5S_33555 [Streptomyces olivaceus]|uniref:hypothetical protein n=1 Tax=Streptomyces olivaceus TaxID=47716 RepID=UPI0036BF7B4A
MAISTSTDSTLTSAAEGTTAASAGARPLPRLAALGLGALPTGPSRATSRTARKRPAVAQRHSATEAEPEPQLVNEANHGTSIEAACRIIILEDQLEEAQRINAEYRRAAESSAPPASG